MRQELTKAFYRARYFFTTRGRYNQLAWKRYLAKRILQFFPVIFGVLILNFILIHTAPGDPIDYLVGTGEASTQTQTQEYLDMMRKHYGLDRPLYEQLFIYVLNVFRGDLGRSIMFPDQPVANLVLDALPYTLLLCGSAVVFSALVGIPLGILCAKKKSTTIDKIVTNGFLGVYSIPTFLLGQLLILAFAYGLGWLPTSGFRTITVTLTGIDAVIDIAKHMILPMISISIWFLALIIRLTKASMLTALDQNYIVFARAKGLDENTVTFKHAFRNALLPVVTILGLNFSSIFSGAVSVEVVFGYPGVGQLLVTALLRRDYSLILGTFTVVSFAVLTIFLITDFAYCLLDPRISYGGRRE